MQRYPFDMKYMVPRQTILPVSCPPWRHHGQTRYNTVELCLESAGGQEPRKEGQSYGV